MRGEIVTPCQPATAPRVLAPRGSDMAGQAGAVCLCIANKGVLVRICRESSAVVGDVIGRDTCSGRGDDPSLLFRRYRSHGPHDELSHRQCRSNRYQPTSSIAAAGEFQGPRLPLHAVVAGPAGIGRAYMGVEGSLSQR